jgi:hypothetical protein
MTLLTNRDDPHVLSRSRWSDGGNFSHSNIELSHIQNRNNTSHLFTQPELAFDESEVRGRLRSEILSIDLN